MYSYDTAFRVSIAPAQVDVATSYPRVRSSPVTSNCPVLRKGKSVMNSHVPFEI